MSQQTAAYSFNWLLQHGYPRHVAAAIVGNLVQESGVNPNVRPGDSGTAHGIAQWRGDRWAGLQNFARANKANPNDLNTQLGYLNYELQGRYRNTLDRMMASRDVRGATGEFVLGYESPAGAQTGVPERTDGWSNRLRTALNVAGNGGGGYSASYQTASTTPSGPIPMVNGVIPAGTTPVSTPTGSTTTTTPASPTPGGAPTPTTPTSGAAPTTPASEPTPTTPSDPGGWEDYVAPVPDYPEYENQVASADDGYQSVPNASWPGLGATSEEGAGGGGGVQMPQTFDNSSETMNALAAAGRQRMAALGDDAQLGDVFANSIGPIGTAGKTSDLSQLLNMANSQNKSQRG